MFEPKLDKVKDPFLNIGSTSISWVVLNLLVSTGIPRLHKNRFQAFAEPRERNNIPSGHNANRNSFKFSSLLQAYVSKNSKVSIVYNSIAVNSLYIDRSIWFWAICLPASNYIQKSVIWNCATGFLEFRDNVAVPKRYCSRRLIPSIEM
jgi:hypothetical protein